MKVGELLSGPTLTSSRALTVFAATVLIVVWTETDPTQLPLLRGFNLVATNVYWLLAGLLAFLAVVHGLNWSNDVVSERKARLYTSHEHHIRNRPNPLFDPTDWLNDTPAGESPQTRRVRYETGGESSDKLRLVMQNAIDSEIAAKQSKWLNFAILFGLHVAVPGMLALAAAASLYFKT